MRGRAYLRVSPPMPMTRTPALLALALLAVAAASAQAPAPGDLVINEVMYDPPAPQPSSNEWVEVLNVTAAPRDVGGLTVSDGGTPSAAVPAGTAIPAGGYLVLVNNGAAFSAAYPGVPFLEVAGFPALNNTGDRPALLLGGVEIDAVPYRPSWGGADASLERRDPLGPSAAASNFGTSTAAASATPGAQNSLFAPDTAGPTLTAAAISDDGRTITVAVSEPLDPASVTPAAFAVSGGPTVTAASYDAAALTVALTLSAPPTPGTITVTATNLRDPRGNTTPTSTAQVTYDPDLQPPTLVSAQATDAQTVVVTFNEPLGRASAETAANYQVTGGPAVASAALTSPTTVTLALAAPLAGPAQVTLTTQNVADARGNASGTQTTTFFFGQGSAAGPRDLVINEFLYDEPTTDNPGEFVEVFNRTDRAFDLRQFTLNDGTGDDQPVTTDARFVAPGGYAVVVEDGALFAAVFPGVPFVEQPSWSALNNSGDVIVLKYQGTTIDRLQYTPAWGGEDASLERKDPDGPSVQANFATTSDLRGGTPGARNSRFEIDRVGPQLTAATASRDGRTVTATVNEPLDPATVTPAAFAVSGATVTAVAYTPGAVTVALTLAAPLAAGDVTVTASGLRDGLGNATATTSTQFAFTPDTQDPGLARATATAPTTVRAEFTEPVTEASALAATYQVVDGPAVASVAVASRSGGGVTAVTLTLATPLADRTIYALAATGLVDLAGRTAARAETRFFFGRADTPTAGQVVITEVMYDPVNGSDGEYVEVLNTTEDRIFDLRAITLGGSGDPRPLAAGAAVVLPGEYVALVRSAAGFQATFPDAGFVVAGSAISLSNSGRPLVIKAGAVTLDSVVYQPRWHRVELEDATGLSLERRDPAGPSNAASNWSSSLADLGGTPSAANSLSISGTPVERETALTITSPFAPTRGEATQITYTLSSEAGLVRARVYDGGGRQVRELEPGRLSGQTATLVWDGTGDDRRPVRAGIYVVLVEAVDAEGGTTDRLRGAVVLARPGE